MCRCRDTVIYKKRKLGDVEKAMILGKGDRIYSKYFPGEREFQNGNGAYKKTEKE